MDEHQKDALRQAGKQTGRFGWQVAKFLGRAYVRRIALLLAILTVGLIVIIVIRVTGHGNLLQSQPPVAAPPVPSPAPQQQTDTLSAAPVPTEKSYGNLKACDPADRGTVAGIFQHVYGGGQLSEMNVATEIEPGTGLATCRYEVTTSDGTGDQLGAVLTVEFAAGSDADQVLGALPQQYPNITRRTITFSNPTDTFDPSLTGNAGGKPLTADVMVAGTNNLLYMAKTPNGYFVSVGATSDAPQTPANEQAVRDVLELTYWNLTYLAA
ncbi:hypothetical protein [Amycolatopsis sp.]|uniref:hypothetical protein n=1 Tax=Amycolatopsis sp. TaxID=37632 RepID=UPI002C062B78|nr:hypothetical protein [Amycolatopsis sp.]HVV12031.1 hypothetical protein [Amycolatopsis sp.]